MINLLQDCNFRSSFTASYERKITEKVNDYLQEILETQFGLFMINKLIFKYKIVAATSILQKYIQLAPVFNNKHVSEKDKQGVIFSRNMLKIMSPDQL